MQDRQGYVLLWRKIRDNHLWPHNRRFTEFEAWIDLLLLAEYKPKTKRYNSENYQLKRGDVFASIRFLSKRWGWGIGKVHRFVLFLKSERMIERKTEHQEQVLTICNYWKFQKIPLKSGTQNGTQSGTQTERKRNEMKEAKELNIVSTNVDTVAPSAKKIKILSKETGLLGDLARAYLEKYRFEPNWEGKHIINFRRVRNKKANVQDEKILEAFKDFLWDDVDPFYKGHSILQFTKYMDRFLEGKI